MSNTNITHKELVEAIKDLPPDSLFELAAFIEYLHYKTLRKSELSEQTTSLKGSSFLLAVAGLGRSGQDDLSEQDEDILASEIDPIRGWGLKSDSPQ